ncbi:MAG: pyridoxamine 5'-phosphate oxidase [Crocinitomicaceae bacterium]|nr:pyridoxamine 5'-phosphate oxidase [Crocinitomicaceae bacterium]
MNNPLDQYRDSHHEFQHDVTSDLGKDPIAVFKEWFAFAHEAEELEANAFVLGTTSADQQSSTRILYLKEILDDQLIFYTNYNSQKGQEIAANPKVSMLFFYPKSSRQIRVEGICTKADESVSDAYFNSRPRGSKIGAWASQQSAELSSMSALTERVAELELKYPNEVPRPDFWGGYQIQPTRFEFWMGKKSRLHERVIFDRVDDGWKIYRKNP